MSRRGAVCTLTLTVLLGVLLVGCTSTKVTRYQDVIAACSFDGGAVIARADGLISRISPEGETVLGQAEDIITVAASNDGAYSAACTPETLLVFNGETTIVLASACKYLEADAYFGPAGQLYVTGKCENDTGSLYHHAYVAAAYSMEGDMLWAREFAGPVQMLLTTQDRVWLAHQAEWPTRDLELTVKNGGTDYLERDFEWENEIICLDLQGEVRKSFVAEGCLPLFGHQADNEFLIGFAATRNGKGSIRRYDIPTGCFTGETVVQGYLVDGFVLNNRSIVLACWGGDSRNPSIEIVRLDKAGSTISRREYPISVLTEVPPLYDTLWASGGETYAVMSSGGRNTLDQKVRVFTQDDKLITTYTVPDSSLQDQALSRVSLDRKGNLWFGDSYFSTGR